MQFRSEVGRDGGALIPARREARPPNIGISRPETYTDALRYHPSNAIARTLNDRGYPQRRRPSHGVQISLNDPTIVWLTVCTLNRRPWLNSGIAHEHLVAVWRAANEWSVGRYILMPDHVHLFCSPHDLNFKLDSWDTYWKSQFTKIAQQSDWRWQSGHWDTRLRRHENYTEKWMYSLQNPVRAGLVATPEDWPFQGELNVLRW